MDKNTTIGLVLSAAFLIVWFTFLQPTRPPETADAVNPSVSGETEIARPRAAVPPQPAAPAAPEAREVVIEKEGLRAVFTTQGAAVQHWYLTEQTGEVVDLVYPDIPQLSTFGTLNYRVIEESNDGVTFAASSPDGWDVTKRYDISADNLHTLTITTTRRNPSAPQPAVDLTWGPGLGTTADQEKENLKLIRALGYPETKPFDLEKLKPGDYPAGNFRWVALDNRYFLAAFVVQGDGDSDFANVSVVKNSKDVPPSLRLGTGVPADAETRSYVMRFYLGPKGHSNLAAFGLGFEETIDYGFFGFLGKIVLRALLFLYGIVGNYGWAIILLTVAIQLLVMPLTLKSFKASAAMKKLQPKMKALQTKYKDDPKRLQMEMLNLYKTQKVNPLGGCLPMLLQLPIFWALFTTLRNAYELRGAPWILWVNDLSAPDALFTMGAFSLNVLPLVMGIGMFVQQKMMAVSTDPTQQRMMYLMPVIFTFMFWGFPAGLVLYWLTNSILTMTEQYFVLRKAESES